MNIKFASSTFFMRFTSLFLLNKSINSSLKILIISSILDIEYNDISTSKLENNSELKL